MREAMKQEPKPCPTCQALALAVMMDQTGYDMPPREWRGLTDDELTALGVIHARHQEETLETAGWFDFARAVEAALKEKNK